jgi:5-methylcytosine-specific restriction enzyme A
MRRRHWSTRARLRILLRHDGICQACGQRIGVKGFELDHAVPLALGGADREENMRPLCRPCHRTKTKVDRGAISRAERLAARHLGAKAPSRTPVPGSRATPWKRKLDGTTVRRDSPRSTDG